MRAVKKFNRGAINFNVGQYAVGIDGANGFAIADWVGLSAMTVNAVIETSIAHNYLSSAFPLFYLSDNQSVINVGLTAGIGGNWTSSAANEYITMSRVSNPNPAAHVYRASTTESVSFINFVSFVYGATPAINLNGAAVSTTAFNTISSATSGLANITRLSLCGYFNGSNAPGKVKVRDLSFFPRAMTLAEHQAFWTMYGGSQNKLGFDDMTIKAHILYKEAIELYTGRREGNVLIAEKKTSHNLQLMGY
jgi:hypothetical protein